MWSHIDKLVNVTIGKFSQFNNNDNQGQIYS